MCNNNKIFNYLEFDQIHKKLNLIPFYANHDNNYKNFRDINTHKDY
jgi:hypothetical protein